MSRYDDDLNRPPQPIQPHSPGPQPLGPTPAVPHPIMPQGVAPQGGPAPIPQHGAQYVAPKPKRRRRIHPACLGCMLFFVGMVTVVSCVSLVAFVVIWNNWSNQATQEIDKAQKDAETTTFQTTTVYDRQGNPLHQLFGEGRRTEVKLADIPKSVIDATIAVEDATFYENPGVDWASVVRAGVQYLQAGHVVSGASTITQQLVRNIAFDYSYRTDVSVQRKIEEIGLALALTREKSKDEILEMYLNEINYGNLAYGIEAAAQTYFGKSAKDLNLAESALLAGLPQAPGELDPLNPDPTIQDEVFARRKTVLDLMVDKDKITRDQANQALAQPLTYANPNVNLHDPHFTLYAESELKNLLQSLNLPPTYITTAGLKVYTTLDPRFESLVESVSTAQINQIKDAHNAHNAAVVILKPTTGEILAMMGSVNYGDASIHGNINMITSPRQPGSAIKPLMYSAAFENGFGAASVLWDVETHIKLQGGPTYSPTDYDNRFHGPVRLRDALANSLNIPAVQTLRSIGVPYLLNFLERLRITSLGTDASKYGLALTLGGGAITPLELAQGYSVLSNGGVLVSPTSILCIIDNDGNVVYQYDNGCSGKATPNSKTISATATGKVVLDPRIAFVLSDILNDNVARTPEMGANSPLRTDGLVTSVKTGTTNDFRDNWTEGFTHNVVVGVWVGNSDNSAMVNTTGLTGAAPIWHDVITGIYANPDMMNILKNNGNLVSDTLTAPPGVYKKVICNLAALKDPATTCSPGRAEWFLDSPAAIPDANGKLTIQPGGVPAQPTAIPANANGPVVIDVDPGVAEALVQPLDPGVARATVVTSPGLPNSPPSRYCLVPNEVKAQISSAVMQFFIKPPKQGDDQIYARIYAQNADLPILPTVPCNQQMLVAGPPAPAGATAVITSPLPGDTITGLAQVSGVANWQPGQAAYYKSEIEGPQFPNWTTFGGPHNIPVINGPLDSFGAAGLQPGIYKVRIVIVGVDGNYLLTSGEIPITITGQ